MTKQRKIFARDHLRGRVLVAASYVRVGETVRFRASFADYTVEEISTDSLGRVRHHFGDGSGSSSYMDGELLWVDRS